VRRLRKYVISVVRQRISKAADKPEAAAAVDRLLMMGIRMPETCYVVFKIQAIKL
jgi:hypothetical protein